MTADPDPIPDVLAEIAAAVSDIEDATKRRDDRIRAASRAGLSARQIAGPANLSHPTIRKIVTTKEQSS